MILRMLIVEDSTYQLNDLERTFIQLNDAQLLLLQVESVYVDKASNVNAAIGYLSQAESRNEPYDILILDLSIPEGEPGAELPENGLRVLDFARRQNATRLIIVASAYNELDRVTAPAFRSGANDFVQKPYTPEEIVLRVIKAWQSYRSEKRQNLLNQARRDLTMPVWKSIAYRFNLYVARFLQDFTKETMELQTELWRRFGLSPQQDGDPSCQKLFAIDRLLDIARITWQQEQTPFNNEDDINSGCSINLESLLKNLSEEMRPCIDIKLTLPTEELPSVFSAGDDVKIVLREMLLGGLIEAGVNDQSWESRIHLTHGNGAVVIALSDNFPTIPLSTVTAVNAGHPLSPSEGQWRAWGVSIVRHLAFCSGGRLEIVPPGPSDKIGNDFNYFIPLG